MWRSKKLILIAVLAVVVLVGSTVGVVLAQDETSGTGQPQTLFERAAAILGTSGTIVTAEQLEAAFTQARQEMRDETIDSRLKVMVEAGTITQEQADQFKAWLAQRPDPSQFREEMKDWQQARPTTPPELKEWLQSRPEMSQGLSGGRAMRPEMPQGLSGGYAPRGGMGRFFMGR
ncbi:MAG: hypothetical protein V1823_04810 [Chloroflexota bacterium]